MTTTTLTDERESLPSASYIPDYWHCPGKRNAERGLPPLPAKSVTDDGNVVHENMEEGITDGTVSQKDITKRLRELEEETIGKWRAEFDITVTPKIFREERLWIRNRTTLRPVASAKLDVFCIYGEFALALDFKTGFKTQVPSELNWQLRCQSIALWHENSDLTTIRSGIATGRFGARVDCTDYNTAEMWAVERELMHILWRTEQPDAPRVPGPQCDYCRAKAGCPQAGALSMLPHVGLPVSKRAPNGLTILDRFNTMTPEQLGFIRARKSTIESILEQVDEKLKHMPEDQLALAGYKLVPGNKNKEITDAGTAFTRLGTVLKDDERLKCLKIVRGRAAELLAEREDLSKEAAQEKVDAALGDVLIDKPGNPRLKAL